MKLLTPTLSALTAGLLMVSVSVFAAKPKPEDCPCYLEWENAVAGTSCVLESSGGRQILPRGDFIKNLSVFEQIGDACFLLTVESSGYVHDVCETTLGTVIEGGLELECVDTIFSDNTYLTPQEIKNCSFVLQQLTIDIGSLPDCEQP